MQPVGECLNGIGQLMFCNQSVRPRCRGGRPGRRARTWRSRRGDSGWETKRCLRTSCRCEPRRACWCSPHPTIAGSPDVQGIRVRPRVSSQVFGAATGCVAARHGVKILKDSGAGMVLRKKQKRCVRETDTPPCLCVPPCLTQSGEPRIDHRRSDTSSVATPRSPWVAPGGSGVPATIIVWRKVTRRQTSNNDSECSERKIFEFFCLL